MDILNTIFGYYDNLISPLSQTKQAIVSLLLLIFLFWQIYLVVRKGHWIFIAFLVILLPGTWPAARVIGRLFWAVIKSLLIRVGLGIN
jgi:hypothetical protein